MKKPSKTPAKVSPIILDKCLALIKIANIDAAAVVKENLMHNANTAVNAKELKNEKASNILIPKNSFIIIFVWVAINRHKKLREI